MKSLKSYYLSRAVISVGFGALLAVSGAPWWAAVLAGAVAFAWFLVAPRIGRYAVQPEKGAAALQRDERSQMINDKSARNAFVVTMLALAGVVIYFEAVASTSVPMSAFRWLLVLGVVVYYVSDAWLRRTYS